jgi:hypothetical protein
VKRLGGEAFHGAFRLRGDDGDGVNPEVVIEQSTERLPCPLCKELVHREATRCPHCQQPIFAKDTGTNPVVGVVVTVVLFFVLFYLLSAFTHYEADKEMKRIQREVERSFPR